MPMIIIGIICILIAAWLFWENKSTEGGRPFCFIIACLLLAFGLGAMVNCFIPDTPASTDKNNSIYVNGGRSGETDLQKKRQEWQKKSNDAYEKGGYWRY